MLSKQTLSVLHLQHLADAVIRRDLYLPWLGAEVLILQDICRCKMFFFFLSHTVGGVFMWIQKVFFSPFKVLLICETQT